MDEQPSFVALAGGAGAGIGSTVPLLLEVDGAVALVVAVASGAMVAGVFFYGVSTLRNRRASSEQKSERGEPVENVTERTTIREPSILLPTP